MAIADATVAGFLAENPRFKFQLYEHVYSSRFIGPARARYREFVQHLRAPPPTNPWVERRALLRQLFGHLPAWREVRWDEPDFESAIPFSDKAALRSRPDEFRSSSIPAEDLWYRETSGTTGPPVRIWYSPAFAVALHYLTVEKLAYVAGVDVPPLRGTDVYSMLITDNPYVDECVSTAPDGSPGLNLRVVHDERDPQGIAKAYAAIGQFRPRILLLKPNLLEALTTGSAGCRLPPEVAAVVTSGANLDPAVRERAQQAWAPAILDAYGMTELGILASDCAQRAGMHLYEHEGIFEVLGSDGQLGPVGEGELVVTSVMNPAMPLPRFRTGDRVVLSQEPCACGLPGRRITRIAGRVFRDFVLSSGARVSPARVNRLFERYPLLEFRLTQVARDVFELELELAATPDDPARVALAVAETVAAALGPGVEVTPRLVQFRSDGKFERFRPL